MESGSSISANGGIESSFVERPDGKGFRNGGSGTGGSIYLGILDEIQIRNNRDMGV